LLDGSKAFGAGVHSVEWDGRDDRGVQVSSGVYWYRLEAGGRSEVRRMVMVK
jgi:flagellar hook assembly protein FlgD